VSTYVGDPQQREQEQIIGTVASVVQKGADKYQAVVAPDGSQYTKNLWTKDAALIGYLSAQIGNRLAFLCNVSHWTNNQNQPVRSLWIERVDPPVVGAPALAGPQPQAFPAPQQAAFPQQPPQQQPFPAPPQQSAVVQPVVTPMVAQPFNDDPKQGKIHRQTGSKVAAILLGYLPEGERTLTNLLVISDRLVAYYDNGLPAAETVEDLMARAMPQSMDTAAATGEGYANTPPPYGDDDIPF
jgi:hypothetical protein